MIEQSELCETCPVTLIDETRLSNTELELQDAGEYYYVKAETPIEEIRVEDALMVLCINSCARARQYGQCSR